MANNNFMMPGTYVDPNLEDEFKSIYQEFADQYNEWYDSLDSTSIYKKQ